jgi:hypothetical protein
MRSSPSRRRRSPSFEELEIRRTMSAQGLGEPVVEDLAEALAAVTPAGVHDLTGLTAARAAYGLTGRGQTVVVIDSGIAYDHAALGGGLGAGYRVVGGWDFAENDANPYDDGPLGSHGTHVAGIIGSSHIVYAGVAPSVDLVALRVFSDSGQGSFAWVEQALAWVHANRGAFANPVTTVNLSVGSAWNSTTVPNWSTLEDELAQLHADGIFVAVAAGNSFTRYNAPGLSYPAASSYVVPVSSVDADGSLSSFSQRHSRALAAPGRGIVSTMPDYRGDQDGLADDFAALSGTSMAAPYVAGAAVLVRQALNLAGHLDVGQDALNYWLRTTADTIYDAATGQNYLRLNLGRALNSILPADEFGSTAAAAHELGTVIGSRTTSGLIGRLDDADYFRFTAASSGQVTLTLAMRGELQPVWEVAGHGQSITAAGQSLTFNVAGGASYTIGLRSGDGLGAYALTVSTVDPLTRIFDEAFYLDTYGDVRAAIAEGRFRSGLDHFVQWGRAAGRTLSSAYDEVYYLQSNPDVQAAVAAGSFASGVDHYVRYGFNEGRQTSPHFHEAAYLALHADVRAAVQAGHFVSGAEHFIRYGRFEGRLATAPVVAAVSMPAGTGADVAAVAESVSQALPIESGHHFVPADALAMASAEVHQAGPAGSSALSAPSAAICIAGWPVTASSTRPDLTDHILALDDPAPLSPLEDLEDDVPLPPASQQPLSDELDRLDLVLSDLAANG